MRRFLITILTLFIIALPLNGVFADHASAASSRVAVIKELKGTVKVKKSGGSKEFTAFAKMSLNEGDVLSVGDGGSAVLQFSNGSSEDDRMTVSSNSKLSFSKLSSKRGTTTKVSMWSGKAWVDVKSISSSSDEFTLETPTAVMGVRGTHLFVTIDPLTQLTQLTVAAGIVRTMGKSSGQESVDVYPSQQILLAPNGEGPSDELKTTIDLEELIHQSTPEVIGAFLSAVADIQEENNRLMQEYRRQLAQLPADALDRIQSNIDNFIGAYVDQAIKQGLVTEQQVNRAIEDAQRTTGQSIDLNKKTITVSDDERRIQEEQRKLDEQLKRQAELKQKQEQQARENALKDKLAELQKQKEQQEQERKEAALKQQQKAKEQYESQLQAAEKERFARDAENRAKEQAAATATNSPSGSPSASQGSSPSQSVSDATLQSLRLMAYAGATSPEGEPANSPQIIELSPAFTSSQTSYAADVKSNVTFVYVKPMANDTGASVTVNGTAVSSGQGLWVQLDEGGNSITIAVTAVGGNITKLYTIEIEKQGSARLVHFAGLKLNEPFDPEVLEYEGEVDTDYIQLAAMPGTSVSVKVNGEALSAQGPNYRYEPSYLVGNNLLEVIVTPFVGAPVTYTFHAFNANPVKLSGLFTEQQKSNVQQIDETTYTGLLSGSETILYVFTKSADSIVEVSRDGTAIAVTGSFYPLTDLDEGWNSFEIRLSDAHQRLQPRTYALHIWQGDEELANVKSWSVSGNDGSDGFAWLNENGEWDIRYSSSAEMLSLTPEMNEDSPFAVHSIKLPSAPQPVTPDEGTLYVPVGMSDYEEAALLLEADGKLISVRMNFHKEIPLAQPSLTGLSVNGEQIALHPEIYDYAYEAYSSTVTILATADEPYEVTINGEPVTDEYELLPGANLFYIEVIDGEDWVEYTLIVYYAALPVGVNSWTTTAAFEGDIAIPIYWYTIPGNDSSHYYAMLPYVRGDAESVTFYIMLEDGAGGKFTFGEEEYAPTMITHTIENPTGYSLIELSTRVGNETYTYMFHLFSPDSIEWSPPTTIEVAYQTSASGTDTLRVEAEWRDGAYYVMLPSDAYLYSSDVALYALSYESSHNNFYWYIDGELIPQAMEGEEEWEREFVFARPGKFASYLVNMIYPVYIYQGKPEIVKDYGAWINELETQDGWILNVEHDLSNHPDDPITWDVGLRLHLPSAYTVMILDPDGRPVESDGEGLFLLNGEIDPGTYMTDLDYEVYVMDADGVTTIGAYKLRVNVRTPDLGGGTITP